MHLHDEKKNQKITFEQNESAYYTLFLKTKNYTKRNQPGLAGFRFLPNSNIIRAI